MSLTFRKKIGQLDTEPNRLRSRPEGLTPPQQALREAVINRFASKKIESYILDQIRHINHKRYVADGIRILFDEHGLPPRNAPLEDIIAARKTLEGDIRMMEAICSALRVHLNKVKEIESIAFEPFEQPDE